MKIPVFLSCASILTPDQSRFRGTIVRLLDAINLQARTLGQTDYPSRNPLYEVTVMARHCAGGVILGFRQFEAIGGVWKGGTSRELVIDEARYFPTPWNNLEAGILHALGLPLLIFRENGIEGGIFDPGVSDVYVHTICCPNDDSEMNALRQVVLSWQTQVRLNYYGRQSTNERPSTERS